MWRSSFSYKLYEDLIKVKHSCNGPTDQPEWIKITINSEGCGHGTLTSKKYTK